MKALLTCAGLGTRLGKLTESWPKPMLQVGSMPIVEHALRNLKHAGIKQVTINLHYMPEVFKSHLGDGSRLGMKIDYVFEQRLLGTAGTIRRMFLDGKTDGPLLVHYGDIVTDMNLYTLIEHHIHSDAWGTILLHRRKGSNSAVQIDSQGWVHSFEERPSVPAKGDFWVFSGICVLSQACLASIPDSVPCDLPLHVLQGLAGTGKLNSCSMQGYRCAIDSIERLQQARQALSCGDYLPAWTREAAA